MDLEPPVHGPGDGHGQGPPDRHGVHPRLPVRFDRGGIGRPSAGVQEGQVFLGGVVDEPKGVPADPAHVGVNNVQDGIRGDGRIHGRPTLL